MSFMEGYLLTRTRKLVKGLAKAELVGSEPWNSHDICSIKGKVEKISLPEDPYVKKFYSKHPKSKYNDPIKIASFDPVPAHIFSSWVLELKEQGVAEEEAMAVADMEHWMEKKAKKKAYARLKQIAKLHGKKPPPSPFPSAIKGIQVEEKKYVIDRFYNRKTLEIVSRLKEEVAAKAQKESEMPGEQHTFSIHRM